MPQPGSATRVVNRLAYFRVDRPHHHADHLARRKELASIVPLLPHLEQQALVHLGEREDVGRVHRLGAEQVHAVDHVEEVAVGVDSRLLDARHDLADHLLARRGARLVAQAAKGRQQLRVHETLDRTKRAVLQRLAFGPIRRRPVAPAVGRFERRRESRAHGTGPLGLACLALVQDSQEEDPGQLRDVLQRAGAVRAPHDVADALDGGVHRLRGREALGVAVWAATRHQVIPLCAKPQTRTGAMFVWVIIR